MASNRKKTEKQKDFQKKKLKVGKTAPKSTSHTDTSFTAKSISLPHQSILKAKNEETEFQKSMSLLRHHSPITRKEVLVNLQKNLPTNISLYSTMIKSIVPLIVDPSRSVRSSLLQLLKTVAESEKGIVELHARSIILFVHSAMSHINVDIRNDSTKFLSFLVEFGTDATVRSSWMKTLRSFFLILNWQLVETKQNLSMAVANSCIQSNDKGRKAREEHLESLGKFLEAGLFEPKSNEGNSAVMKIPHPYTCHYLLPTTPQPYAHLKIFAKQLSNTEDVNCDDVETRRVVFLEHFAKGVRKGIEGAIKEGGLVAKECKNLQIIVNRVSV